MYINTDTRSHNYCDITIEDSDLTLSDVMSTDDAVNMFWANLNECLTGYDNEKIQVFATLLNQHLSINDVSKLVDMLQENVPE